MALISALRTTFMRIAAGVRDQGTARGCLQTCDAPKSRRLEREAVAITGISPRADPLQVPRHRDAERRSQRIPHVDRDQQRRPDRTTRVMFDPDDIDAAFEELDARYLAGEAAAHAHTWSLIAEAYAALNRHELPPTTLGLGQHRPPARDVIRVR